MPTKHRIFTMSVASVYPYYVAKAEDSEAMIWFWRVAQLTTGFGNFLVGLRLIPF